LIDMLFSKTFLVQLKAKKGNQDNTLGKVENVHKILSIIYSKN